MTISLGRLAAAELARLRRENEQLPLERDILRTFAHSAFACGSMVLCRYCVSFFAPFGAKNDTQGIESDLQAKVLLSYASFFARWAKNDA